MNKITIAAVCGKEFSIMKDAEKMAEWLLARMMSGKTVSMRAFDEDSPTCATDIKEWMGKLSLMT